MIIHGASESLKGQKVRKYIRRNGFKPLDEIKEGLDDEKTSDHIRKAFVKSSNNNKHWRYVGRSSEGEGGADAWPAWLRAAAGDAIDGWLPLKSDNFERLEKIGQGTYSNVYRARDLQTGRIVALKKVQFDNFKPESVSFMAREIKILRRLDHPNVMKLEGIITSKLSCDIYLVFEYMEHDLCGLLSCPHVKFTASQIKCYMLQLLKGIQHCHSRGVLHRDIKSSNILINNKGVLKIADFGLANFFDDRNKQPLTNRVVTLWYRPPELLLGSTSYGPCVDMWSVGCVFAEFFNGRPILKGRTEYFYAKPYACDPATLPTYPPNKEINAKFREAAQRKTDGGKSRASGCSRKPRKALSCKVIPEDRNLYMFRSRDSLNSKAVSEVSQRGDSIGTVPAQAVASYGRFMWETRRQEHLQRYQSLMQPDFLNSTQVYKPRDDQEPEISRHMIMLHQLRSADVMQLEDYIRAGAHQSHSSRGAVANDKW
ncbi:hypothetical protein M8C21_014482, partial [Ambrosia artemisiifolia]